VHEATNSAGVRTLAEQFREDGPDFHARTVTRRHTSNLKAPHGPIRISSPIIPGAFCFDRGFVHHEFLGTNVNGHFEQGREGM